MNIFRRNKINEYDDDVLLEEYKSGGNMEFLGILYQRYTSLVYGVCLKYFKDREISKDAVMDIFEYLTDAVHRYKIRNFKSWLHVTARNHCLMILRKKTMETNLSENQEFIMENHSDTHPDSENALDHNLEALKKCIEKLNQEQKSCVSLFYLQGKSYQQIESQTKFPLKKVKSHIQNGKRNLKICLEKSE